jgi:type IV secretion system protein VirB9
MRAAAAALALVASLLSWAGRGYGDEPGGAVGRGDSRLRSVSYDAGTVYRLRGYVGYQIDLEFEPGERFVGLGAGDIEGLAYAAQANHLFIKPRAARVRTNLTVLTSRRSYHFDYEVASAVGPNPADPELLYGLRFDYPAAPAVADEAARRLEQPVGADRSNHDYWYCGSEALQPVGAFDDGIHTHLRFSARGELPAVFLVNDDGTESLLNFSVTSGEMVIHRVAARFVLRRGRLYGCVVNRGPLGSNRELSSGTVAPDVERDTRAGVP